MKLTEKELLTINGGAVSAVLINAIVKGISLLIDLGKSLGSTIRRISENKTCEI